MAAPRHTFTVFDAGEVEIERDGDEVRVTGVIAGEGWAFEEALVEEGGVEVEFERAGHEAEFEAEIDGDRLRIEIEYEWSDAQDGIYEVGVAGEVEFRLEDEGLVLVEVRPAEGWEYTVIEQDDNEGDADGEPDQGDGSDDEENEAQDVESKLKVEFQHGESEAGFSVELSDGRLEVEVELEWYLDE